MKPGRLRIHGNPRRCSNRVEVADQGCRPHHPRCLEAECQDRSVDQQFRGRLLRDQFPYLGAPRRDCNPRRYDIKNKLHFTRDVTFQEDQSRIRHNPGVFARLRSFAYNILRRNLTSTFNQDRYAAALAGFDALLRWRVS